MFHTEKRSRNMLIIIIIIIKQEEIEPEIEACLLLEGEFLQDGLQNGVKLLPYVLQKYWRAKLDGVLHDPHVVGVRQLDDAQLVLLLQVLDPLVGLACTRWEW